MGYAPVYYGSGSGSPTTGVVRADLNNVFGPANITKWADLDNEENSVTITARIEWAIGLAEAEVQSRVSVTSYAWSDVLTNPLVKHAVALKAGLLLYANRGVSDEEEKSNPMRKHEKDYEKFFKDLVAGSVSLGATQGGRGFPAVVVQGRGDVSTGSWTNG